MARLIVKSPYIKGGGGGGAGGYLKYIGTRDGVELLPSGYMEYMAERPRSHGLFGDEDNVDLNAAMKELTKYPGNVWTHIISLKREDAERLGYDHAAQWRNLLRTHRNEIAEAMHIPPSDFRWYAAFHDEGDHPHVHMMAWSAKPGQAYLSKDGIREIKSNLTNDIFRQEMLHIYEQKSSTRDELVRKARAEMKSLAQEMRQTIGNYPEVESLMMTLASQLETVKGKKKYGYLSKDMKNTVDEIVNQMERFPIVNDCYQSWWDIQCQIKDFYSEKKRQRPPLSAQKEFRSIKNAIIQEAEALRLGKITFEDSGSEQTAIDFSSLPYNCWEQWIITQDDTASLAERDEAAAKLIESAEDGDFYAQYLVGKLYQDGPVLIPDNVAALHWFEKAAQQGHAAASYEMGKILLSDDAEVHDPSWGMQWLEYAARIGNNCAAYCLGKEYLKGKIVPQDTAKAMDYLTQSAEAGNQFAQYALGKLYLDEHNQEQAHYWFVQSASQGNEYAQFFLRYTIRPIQEVVDLYHQRQLRKLEAGAGHRKIPHSKRKRRVSPCEPVCGPPALQDNHDHLHRTKGHCRPSVAACESGDPEASPARRKQSGGGEGKAGESPGAFAAPGQSLPPAVRAVEGERGLTLFRETEIAVDACFPQNTEKYRCCRIFGNATIKGKEFLHMKNEKADKNRHTIWLTDEAWNAVSRHYREDNCSAHNEYIEKAIRFYSGYLDNQNASAYLPRVLSDILEGKLGVLGSRIGRLLFKLAVEQNMTANILASEINVGLDTMEKVRSRCVREVKQINGEIKFEDALKYQKGWD